MTEAQTIADRVRAIREARGYSQAELSRRAGLAKSSVNDLEGTSSRSPSLATLGAIADALDVHVGTLIGVDPACDTAGRIEEISIDALTEAADDMGFGCVHPAEGTRFFRAEAGFSLHAIRFHPGDLLIVSPLSAAGTAAPCIIERKNPIPAFEARLFLNPYLIAPDRDGILKFDMVPSADLDVIGEITVRLGRLI